MAIDTKAINSQPTDNMVAGNSKELIYMSHLLNTLSKAQTSFDTMNKDSLSRFNLYMCYLSNAILDDDTRNNIENEMAKEGERLRKTGRYSDTEIQYMTGFVVVRHTIRYINDIFEISHTDINSSFGGSDLENIEYNGEDLFEEDEDGQ